MSSSASRKSVAHSFALLGTGHFDEIYYSSNPTRTKRGYIHQRIAL